MAHKRDIVDRQDEWTTGRKRRKTDGGNEKHVHAAEERVQSGRPHDFERQGEELVRIGKGPRFHVRHRKCGKQHCLPGIRKEDKSVFRRFKNHRAEDTESVLLHARPATVHEAPNINANPHARTEYQGGSLS